MDVERRSSVVGANADNVTVAEKGHASQQEDHEMTKWQAIKKNPINFAWTLFGVWTLIVISFDSQAGGLVISIPEFRKDYGHPYNGGYVVDATWQSAFSGGPTASSVVGSLIAAWFADKFGRKWVIFAGVALTFVGVALEFVSTEVKVFFAGKFVNGFSLGILTTTCLTWVSEIAPLSMRGLMTGLCNVSFCIGPFVCVLIANTTANYTNHWAYRALFAAQWGFGATSLIIAPFMPESPWYLLAQGKEADVLKSLRKLGHSEDSAESHLAAMKVTQAAAEKETEGASYLECFKGTNLRRTILTIMPFSIQALSGVVWIASYQTYYYQLAGVSTSRSFAIGCGAQALSISGNIIAFFIIDRIGRRPLLLWAFGFLTVLLCVTGGLGTMTHNNSAVLATIGLMTIYNFAYNFALGAVVYAVIAETPTSRLRIKTIAMSTTIQQALFTMWQFVLPYIINPDQANLGASTAFIFGGLSVLCWIYLFFFQPETARRSFEEIDELFFKKVPARKFKGYVTDAQLKAQQASEGKVDVEYVENKA